MSSVDNKKEYVPVLPIPDEDRFNRLNKIFYEEFHSYPTFYVKVPGRVNIIGEHIDYCGYPVLPMALQQDIIIASEVIKTKKVELRNVNKKYESYDFCVSNYEDIEIKHDKNGKPFWYNYVSCGVKGALEYLENNLNCGLRMVIDGNVPPASGLSSSSALVSASCLCLLYAQKVKISKTQIADLCAKSERYIGTEGGGMDQAIAFLAEKQKAQYITWNPLRATPITLPKSAVFVVAHSLAEANKAATNDFNIRVIECRLAAKVLAVLTKVDTLGKIFTLSEVQKHLNKVLKDMINIVQIYLSQEIYTKNDISNILGIEDSEMDKFYLTPNTRHVTRFHLRQRALHVYEEALRVEDFCATCLENSTDEIPTNGSCDNIETSIENRTAKISTIEKLGKLMSDSHESLKNLYECSHVSLDELVDVSKSMNINARLTGAGWGGCIVALCPQDKVNEYINKLKEEFYFKRNILKNVDTYVFATNPNQGAVIYCDQ